jgi:hypothetical protein
MCFSASASFGAGVVLTVIGVATLRKPRQPSQLLFASIPLLFGIQQIAEGILWLALPNPDYVNTQKIFTYLFLFFAQVLWPVWVPLSILLLEKNTVRKNILKVLVGAGVVVGVYLAYSLFTFSVEAKIDGKHIAYLQDYPVSLRNYGFILYALATMVPPFVSHIKRMWLFGLAILISYLVSELFFENYIVSVWCFFAAIISLSIFAIMTDISKKEQHKSLTNNGIH